MFGTFAFGAVTAPFAWVTPIALTTSSSCSGFGAVSIVALFCDQPLAQARARERGRAVPVHDARLGDRCSATSVFGDVPDGFMLAGSAIIVAAGLYIFWREQIAAREATRSRRRPA